MSANQIAPELHSACLAGDALAASDLAHKLKSAARSVGALALGDLCDAMEQAGKARDAAALMVLCPQFDHENGRVLDFLRMFKTGNATEIVKWRSPHENHIPT